MIAGIAKRAPTEVGPGIAPRSRMQEHFDRPVSAYMSRDVEAAAPDATLEDLARTIQTRDISGIPILDGNAIVGVVSRTDLIQAGCSLPRLRWGAGPAMPLPKLRARDVMTHDPRTILASTSLREAAAMMSSYAIHRVFVTDRDRRLIGVLSTVDLAAAVSDARLTATLESAMTSPIVTLDVKAPLGTAVDVLASVAITGVIVTEEGIPVGVFTQADALASRELPRRTPIDTTCDVGVMCMAHDTKLHRAAAHAARLDVRRIVVCRDREAIGVVGGLDFARIVATA